MNQPLFLSPIFQKRIWGGTALRDYFGYTIPSGRIGECWGVSGHSNGQSIILNGKYQGKKLGEIWGVDRGLFGNDSSEVFPLLVKILDANADLSIQVHPNDQYANAYENGELGKTECWYIIDCKEEAEIVFGHTAHSKKEFIEQINSGNWSSLLHKVKIKPGDFFYVPSGTIHALCEGTLVLEIQQSSDTTYRLYDYDRVDENGNKRELHIEKVIEVTIIPHEKASVNTVVKNHMGMKWTTFVKSEFFSVYKWDVQSIVHYEQTHNFMLCSVLKGSGKLIMGNESYIVEKGAHFILPASCGNFSLEGKIELIVCHT
ncbi:mannose-6-phosphate isomerase, class I [Bacillus thuringiensis]|uniref:mannose-6-phosphate isomerase, class I n=1 Tax=Bacillus thuringiensis TaxID=1428 RepID=UPI000A3744A0|nr:mannose-6-phosphate isomerase, class I [Bacillus thuringiensis]OUA97982.1 mannose-6-phosphate isomerase, class I [Bacillus thuringiensis serovar leesis]